MFDIEKTSSFNTDKLIEGEKFDYVTRTSVNQGILQSTGFINEENINESGTWSLGLLQMDFFYRKKPWYAGQFVRKIIPKNEIKDRAVPFFTVILNALKPVLLNVLVRNVNKTFANSIIQLPTKNGKMDFEFMESFVAELQEQRVAELEEQRVAELEAYLTVTGLKDYELTEEEWRAVSEFDEILWAEYKFEEIFDQIKQGRRLKLSDQISGDVPFVMSGVTNSGIANYISNPINCFPSNSITVDIFGNAFYRNFEYSASDDTGVYWSKKIKHSQKTMLFLSCSVEKALFGKYSYGNKLRSSQSKKLLMKLPIVDGVIDYSYMDILISAIQKLVIKDIVLWADNKIEATKEVISQNELLRK